MNKGLKFTPSPKPNPGELRHNISKFCRRLRLKEYYHGSENTDDSLIRNEGTFNPPRGRNRTLDVVIDNIMRIPVTRNGKQKCNLTKDQLKALNDLQNMSGIIIKEADKGKAVVVMDEAYYREKITQMLQDNTTYQHLQTNEDTNILRKLDSLIESSPNSLTKQEKDYLTKFDCKTSQFYGLPKIHKCNSIISSQIRQDGYIHYPQPDDLKFRPIVAGPASPTHRISKFIDILLRPFLPHIESYLKDNTDFLQKLPRIVAEETILVTFDVVSLYSNIPHDLGMKALKFWLEKYKEKIHNRFSSEFILKSATFILENNTFQFNGQNYKQISGTAMGTPFAPTYANLTMGYLENHILHSKLIEEFGPEDTNMIEKHFYRYLDDCWVTWFLGIQKLDIFTNLLNNMNPNIKFTMSTSTKQLPFLDILVLKDGRNLKCDLFSKVTDTKRYVPFSSNHPRHIKTNIPFNLARRIRKIVDDPVTETTRYEELFKDLRYQQYPAEIIKEGIRRAKLLTKDTLRTIRKQSTADEGIPLVTIQNPNNQNVLPTIQTSWNILQNDPETRDVFKGLKIINSKAQPKNLKKLLCRAKFPTKENIGVEKCGKVRCQLCECLITGREYKFEHNHIFRVKSSFTCDSKNVIYCIKCAGCEKTYIGETSDLRMRVNLHRNQIRRPEYNVLNMSRHIAECAKERSIKFYIFPFYQVVGTNEERLAKENYFIHKFKPTLNSFL